VTRLITAGLISSSALALATAALAQQSPAAGQINPNQLPSLNSLTVPQAASPAAGTIQDAPPQAAAPPPAAAGPQRGPAARGPAAAAPAPGGPRAYQAGPIGPGPAAPGPAAGPGPAAARPPGAPAAPAGAWEVQPQVHQDGSFSYCLANAHYDNNLVLVIGANPEKKLNVAIAVPGAKMQAGAGVPVTVKIDGKFERKVDGVVATPELIVANFGNDDGLKQGLIGGNILAFQVPGDTATFQLKGTGKAMAELMQCVEKASAGQMKLPEPPPPIPPQLADVLVKAGLQDAKPILLENVPQDRRPGDFAWRVGDKVVGSVRYFNLPPDEGDLRAVSEKYVEALGKSCDGTFTKNMDDVESLPAITLRTGNAACDGKSGKVNVAILMYLTPGRTFAVFSHEAADPEKAVAEKANSGLAAAFREIARQPPQPDPQAVQAAGPRRNMAGPRRQ
jgi:hypothetical protein